VKLSKLSIVMISLVFIVVALNIYFAYNTMCPSDAKGCWSRGQINIQGAQFNNHILVILIISLALSIITSLVYSLFFVISKEEDVGFMLNYDINIFCILFIVLNIMLHWFTLVKMS
jgi:hypothetical protein